MPLRPDQIAYGASLHAARKKLGTVVDEKTASQLAPESFGGMDYDGKLIRAGTIIQWRGDKKKAAADLWDREDSNPDNAPTLWDDIEYHDGVRVIPDVYKPGQMFAQGEEGWWHGSDNAPMGVYVSQIPANVTHPGDERWWKLKARDGDAEPTDPIDPTDPGGDEPSPELGTLANPIPYPETGGTFAVVNGKYYSYKGKVYLAKADMPSCVWPPDTGIWQWGQVG